VSQLRSAPFVSFQRNNCDDPLRPYSDQGQSEVYFALRSHARREMVQTDDRETGRSQFKERIHGDYPYESYKIP